MGLIRKRSERLQVQLVSKIVEVCLLNVIDDRCRPTDRPFYRSTLIVEPVTIDAETQKQIQKTKRTLLGAKKEDKQQQQ